MRIPADPAKGWMTRPLARAALFGLVVMAMAPATSSPASAGLLEFLFGRRDPAPQRQYAPRERYYAPLASGPSRRAIKPGKAKPKAKPQTQLAETERPTYVRPMVVAGPLGHFLHDPTLQRGDVVVTSDGLKIFAGSSKTQHAANDFIALDRARGLVAGNSLALVSIERANRYARRQLEDAQIAPSPGPVTALPAGAPDKQAALEATAAP